MIMPETITQVILDGHDISLEEFAAVARYNAPVRLSDAVLSKMRKSREYVEKIIEQNETAYGITTGLGALSNVRIDPQQSGTLATNLVLSHCVATGDPYKDEQVRGMMFLLANNLSHGYSGCRPGTGSGDSI